MAWTGLTRVGLVHILVFDIFPRSLRKLYNYCAENTGRLNRAVLSHISYECFESFIFLDFYPQKNEQNACFIFKYGLSFIPKVAVRKQIQLNYHQINKEK